MFHCRKPGALAAVAAAAQPQSSHACFQARGKGCSQAGIHAIRELCEAQATLFCFSTPFAAYFWPGLERALEGAQLDREFAFLVLRLSPPASRGTHSWTEIFLSTPLATVFGTGPEAGRRGAQLNEEFC